MTAPMPYVAVAGMRVPAVLVPRIVAAMRGTYPGVTADLDDDAAVRAVLRWWVKSTLTNWEARQAEAPVDDALAETRQTYRNLADAARQQAEADASTITDQPPTSPPVDPAV